MRFVRGFAEVGAADVALVGGKGANLGELVRAGLPVPDGVVLTTEAYAVAAAGVDVSSPGVQEAFLGLSVPSEVAVEVRAAYAGLGGGPVAVRSSSFSPSIA